MFSKPVIKSIGYSNSEILKNILTLYIPEGKYDLDPTYSTGKFYKEIEPPTLKFDAIPKSPGVLEADCRHLPLENSSVNSIVFDPPFIIRRASKPTPRRSIIADRFSSFRSKEDIKEMYKQSLQEFYRILKSKGLLVFKCQDFTDSSSFFTHNVVYDLATDVGFYPLDLFILIASSRLIGGLWKVQHHARKYHSYFWVFRKPKT